MSYFQIVVDAHAEDADALEPALERLGALSVTLTDRGDQPLLEPGVGEQPLWPVLSATALFDAADHEPEAVRQRLLSALGWGDLPGWRVEPVPEREWERVWLEDFRPQRFGERLWVSPTAMAPAAGPEEVVVWLDPGLAFGTGTHPTTALCLEWLARQPLAGRTVVDYGCGSGILAVAALRLGAGHCIAVDNDPQALHATRENALLNGVAGRLTVGAAGELAPEPGEVLVANILSGILVALAPELLRWLRPGGAVALSGILQDQASDVRRAFEPAVSWSEPRQREEWMLLCGVRGAA